MQKKIKIFYIIISFSLFGTLVVSAQSFQWAENVNDWHQDIYTDKSGFSYVSGGLNGFFIAKYNPNGGIVWTHSGVGNVSNSSICLDAFGNVYIIGSFSYSITIGTTTLTATGPYAGADIFIAKYDTAGNFYWAKKAGGINDDHGFGICADNVGNIYATGTFLDTAMFDSVSVISRGDADIFVAKYDSTGVLIWLDQAGGGGMTNRADWVRDICIDKLNNIFITGTFYPDTSYFGGISVIRPGSAGEESIFTAKYNSDGLVQWVKVADALGGNNERCNSIAVDTSGNPIVTGGFYGTLFFDTLSISSAGIWNYDVFLAKYSTDGNIIWLTKAGGTGLYDMGNSISINSLNKIFLSGDYTGTAVFDTISINTGSGNDHIFIAEYDDSLGSCRWVLGTGGWIGGGAISSDTAGNIFITGGYTNSATFGYITLTGNGNVPFMCKVSSTLPVSINENSFETNKTRVYPSPCSDFTVFEFEYNKNKKYTLELFNSIGQSVEKINNIPTNQIRIERGNFKNGLYFIQLKQENKIIATEKLVITDKTIY